MVLVTVETEAGESFEPRRLRLQRAMIAPLHSNLDYLRDPVSKGKKKKREIKARKNLKRRSHYNPVPLFTESILRAGRKRSGWATPLTHMEPIRSQIEALEPHP